MISSKSLRDGDPDSQLLLLQGKELEGVGVTKHLKNNSPSPILPCAVCGEGAVEQCLYLQGFQELEITPLP